MMMIKIITRDAENDNDDDAGYEHDAIEDGKRICISKQG